MVSQTITGYKSSTCNYVRFDVVMMVTWDVLQSST